MDRLGSWGIDHFAIVVPIFLFVAQLCIRTYNFLRTGDVYSLMLGVGGSGIEMSILALGAYISLASRGEILMFHELDKIQALKWFVIVLIVYLFLLGVASASQAATRLITKKCYPINRKIEYLKQIFSDRIIAVLITDHVRADRDFDIFKNTIMTHMVLSVTVVVSLVSGVSALASVIVMMGR